MDGSRSFNNMRLVQLNQIVSDCRVHVCICTLCTSGIHKWNKYFELKTRGAAAPTQTTCLISDAIANCIFQGHIKFSVQTTHKHKHHNAQTTHTHTLH